MKNIATNMETRRLILPFFVLIGIFFAIGYGYAYFFVPDCIRSTIDGSVHCECDFDNSAAWQKYREDTRGGWEDVVVKSDPCK